MIKGVIAFLIIAVLIPGLFVVAKVTFPPKQSGVGPGPTDSAGEKKPAENNSSKPAPQYKVITGPKLMPVDEASKNDSFARFRTELNTAVKNKDIGFLKQHIDEKIKYSFGDNSGIDGFIREWKLDKDPQNSQLWVELEKVITLGGAFDTRGAFVAPYVFAKFPESVDAFVYAAVIDKNVKLYANPDDKSQVVGLLNYNIVKTAEFRKDRPWQKVSAENLEGYVETKYIRSPIDYRAYLEEKDGVWKMVFFVAGD